MVTTTNLFASTVAAPVSAVTVRDLAVACAVLNGRATELTAGTTGGSNAQLVVTDISGALHSVAVTVRRQPRRQPYPQTPVLRLPGE